MAYATDPVAWVFADECHRATRGQGGFVTPTGAVLRRLFLIGVLTEVHVQNSRAVEARVTDPTGGFSISVNHSFPLVADLLAATEPPAFIALAGELAQKGREEIRLIADACQLVSRKTVTASSASVPKIRSDGYRGWMMALANTCRSQRW